jgi:hypothetical protein
MTERLAELQLMLGESRRRLGALAERVAEVRRRIEPAGAAAAAQSFEEGVSGARELKERELEEIEAVDDIDELDLKFEALVIDGSDQDKLPEG